MQFETYQRQRDDLIRLAGDLSAALKGVPEAKTATVKTLSAEMDAAKGKETSTVKAIPVADELGAVKAKLEEGQFRIALFAGFQCGKSTTFDALLGGQEISPRGQLVATSSAILYGMHTDDPALQGKAEVEWKDKRELLTILPPTILDHLAEVPALKGRMKDIKTVAQLSEKFDLDNSQDLRYLREACAKEWRRYHKNRGAYPDDLRAVLRVAVLMLAKYDRPAIKAMRKNPNKRYSVDEIDRFVRFPKSWEGRSTQEKQDFSDEESLFVFVKRVRCYVNAPALKKIDCTLVDCPGLGASEYDKQVATEEIQDCDVVWFLLGDGRRDIGEDELRNIRTGVKLKPDGLIFTMNVTDSKKNLREHVAPSTCAKINSTVGKDGKTILSPDDITFYHARLALSAEQACRLREGTLTKASQKAILENAQAIYDGVTKVEDALDGLAVEDLKKTGVFFKDPRLQNFSLFAGKGLNADNVKWAREQSDVDTLVDRIHAIVMRDKAKIILKTNGFDRVQVAFKAFEAKVTGLLDDLAKSKQEAEAKYEAQEKRISALGNAMQEALNSDELDIGDLAERLRREFVSEVLNPSRDETLAAIERRADTLMGLSDNELQNAIGGLLNDSIRNNLAAWRQSLKNGDSPAIQRFIDKIKKIVDRLNREFKAKAEAKGMGGAANAGDASISIGEIDLGIDWFEWISVASNALFFIPIGGWILRGLIAAGIIAITSLFVGKSWKRNKFIESATEKITEGCRDFERSALPAKMEEMAEGMRKSCVANLQSAIRLRLEEEQKALKQLRQKLDSGDKDKDIARLNKVKADIIAPFAKRLADFAKQLDAAF